MTAELPPLVRVERCPACGGPGGLLYAGLKDCLGSLPGEWSFQRCARGDCGHLWMDPAIRADALGWAYQDYFTHEDDALPSTSRLGPLGRPLREAAHWLTGLGPEWRRRQVMFLPPGNGRRVLDVGTGRGDLLLDLQRHGWQVEGLEMDPQAAKAAGARLGAPVHVGSIADADLEGAFDAVTMQHVLEHLPDARGDLRRIASWLAPGGTVHIVTPNAGSRLHRQFGASWRGLEVPTHVQVFTADSLPRMVAGTGLVVDRIFTSAAVNHGVWLASRFIRKHGSVPAGKVGPVELLGCFAELAAGNVAHHRDARSGEELVAVLRAGG